MACKRRRRRCRPRPRSTRIRRRCGSGAIRTSRAPPVAGRRGQAWRPSLRGASARCKVRSSSRIGEAAQGDAGMLIALLVPLMLAFLLLGFILLRSVIAKRALPNPEAIAVGVVVNFFDTLGIGSFATTTAWLKFRRLVPDRLLPQTMLVGLTPPSMLQAVIFLILL